MIGFGTRPRRGEHLVGAAAVLGIEGRSKADHHGQVLGREEFGHEIEFLDADAVLARHATTLFDALVEDFMARLQDTPYLVGIAFVEE